MSKIALMSSSLRQLTVSHKKQQPREQHNDKDRRQTFDAPTHHNEEVVNAFYCALFDLKK